MSKKLTYEDKQAAIDFLIKKRKNRWNMGALSWFDFDDVEQIIRAHIFKKWDQWDQSRPIEPWVNRIITNQIKNILRNNYSNFLKPCCGCPFNQEDIGVEEGCSFTKSGEQTTKCPLFAKWTKTKKTAYNIKMAAPLEGYEYSQASSVSTFMDWEKAQLKLNIELKKVLTEKQFKIYSLLFVENLEEEEVAKIMGYKTSEKGRTAGYRQIKNLKKIYKKKAEDILKNKDIFL
jgi:DNA-directed RNA polymerase specialized sigma24 family protein